MKEYIKGIITGLSITIALFLFVGAQQKKDDSLNTIMGQLDTYVKDQLDKDKAAVRYQLKSFQIETKFRSDLSMCSTSSNEKKTNLWDLISEFECRGLAARGLPH